MTPEFNWSPGIGDPSFGGWFTVLLYVGAAYLSYRTAKFVDVLGAPRAEFVVWLLLAVCLGLLGINKQLDLQSALTELGRYLAYHQGWYEYRRTVQFLFILTILVLAVVLGIFILLLVWQMPKPTILALLGALFIVGFVLVRAASFHQVDHLIGTSILGLRWNWIIEMGGLVIVQIAGIWRTRYEPILVDNIER